MLTIIVFTILAFCFLRSNRRGIALFFLPVTVAITFLPVLLDMVPTHAVNDMAGFISFVVIGCLGIGYVQVRIIEG